MTAAGTVTVVLATGATQGWADRLGLAAGVEVRYLGDRFERLSELRDGAGEAADVQGAGALIDPWADRTLEDLRNLDRCIGDGVVRRWWEASNLGERNQLNSGCHFRLCVLLAFDERLLEPADLVVLLDDPWLAHRLASCARATGRPTVALDLDGRPLATGSMSALLHRGVAIWRGLRLQCQWWRRQARQAGIVRRMRAGHAPADALRGCDALLVLWGNTHTFDAADGTLPYLGAVPAMLADEGLRVGFVLMPVDWAQPFEDIAGAVLNADRPVLLLPECSGLVALTRAVLGVLGFVLSARPRMRMHGVDVSALLRDEVLREIQDTRMAFALQLRSVAHWLARHAAAPRLVVHPYENQSWEKCLRSGVRDRLPGTRVVGCMHMPGAARFISFNPSDKELAAGEIPDRLLVLGPAVKSSFLAGGFPAERIDIGGAVRMPGWPAALRAVSAPPRAPAGHARVLVATGMSGGDSLELLGKAVPAILALPDTRAVVNFHPQVGAQARASLQRAALRGLEDADAARVEFSDAGASELLATVDALVYNVSAVAFDAVIAGVPTLFVCSEVAVDLDKLPSGVSARARTVQEIRTALQAMTGEDREHRARAARLAAAPVFAPVAVEPWARLAAEVRGPAGPGSPAIGRWSRDELRNDLGG